MSRFDYIKTRRAKRNKNQDAIEKIRSEIAAKATGMVNRIVKTMDPETAGQMAIASRVMQNRSQTLKKLVDADRDPVGPIIVKSDSTGAILFDGPSDFYTNPTLAPDPEDIKQRKLRKIDRFLLKQKVAKLHNQLDSMNEDSLGNNALKYLLKNILVTRAKEFEEDQTAQKMMQKLLKTDDLAYLATMTNLDQPVDARTVGQLFEILRKMGLTVKIEIGKNANTPIDSLRTKTDITCQYVEGKK